MEPDIFIAPSPDAPSRGHQKYIYRDLAPRSIDWKEEECTWMNSRSFIQSSIFIYNSYFTTYYITTYFTEILYAIPLFGASHRSTHLISSHVLIVIVISFLSLVTRATKCTVFSISRSCIYLSSVPLINIALNYINIATQPYSQPRRDSLILCTDDKSFPPARLESISFFSLYCFIADSLS